jgi:putative ABC transport system substrate-binding protein
MPMVNDPAGHGFGASLARPGGNITGLSSVASELAGKTVAWLTELLPTLPPVATLWHPNNPGSAAALKEAEVAAHALGVTLHPRAMRSPNGVEGAFHHPRRC